MSRGPLAYSAREKMEVTVTSPLETSEDLSNAYTPGIAQVAKLIQENEEAMFSHTFRRNNLAVISDGSAVLGLGNIGHKAGYPIMEGKAMLFKRFGGINAIPLVVKTQEVDEFVEVVMNIADSFAAINLEDISAPKCFEIEERLKKSLSIPVMHDDQHGTAVVVLAAMINALTLYPNKDKQTSIVMSGVGAAGVAIAKMLSAYGYKHLVMVDSRGIISKSRKDLNSMKQGLLTFTNPENLTGSLETAMQGAGVFIGVSKGGLLTSSLIKRMNAKPIIIAMANPVPEVMPNLAMKAGAVLVATGRSDFPNQVNNALAFPGIFRGAIDARAKISEKMKLAAAEAIVKYHQDSLRADHLLPDILDAKIHAFIAREVKNVA